jgi:hypothetical protein
LNTWLLQVVVLVALIVVVAVVQAVIATRLLAKLQVVVEAQKQKHLFPRMLLTP